VAPKLSLSLYCVVAVEEEEEQQQQQQQHTKYNRPMGQRRKWAPLNRWHFTSCKNVDGSFPSNYPDIFFLLLFLFIYLFFSVQTFTLPAT
jgi:hypothetical protein